MTTVKFIRNLVLGMAILFGAQTAVLAITSVATVGTNSSAFNVFYTGGVAGGLNIMTNNAFLRSKVGLGFNPNVTVQFSPMTAIPGTYIYNADGVWHLFVREANGGSIGFVVTDNVNGNVLLRGNFRKAILHGRTGSSSLAITLPADTVTYTQQSLALPDGANLLNGSLSIAILSQFPVVADPMNGPAMFNANGDINFGIAD